MASKLSKIADDINTQERIKEEELKRQKEFAHQAKLNSAREWIGNIYIKNQPQMKDFENKAKQGYHSKTIFKAYNYGKWNNYYGGYTPYDIIGLASKKDIIPHYQYTDFAANEHEKLATNGCEMVKKMFSEANKKNNWGFTIHDTCQSRDKTVSVRWY
jgi:hypothetical protein